MSIRALPPGPPREPLVRLSVHQYHAIIRAGVFNEDDPIELLDGWLVKKMPKNPPHSVATGLAYRALAPLLPPGWDIISQDPITTDDSEPEPDVCAVRGKIQDYTESHPQPKDVGLVVEVADSTLRRDRTTKKTIYARANIPMYWIVNLVDRCVEVYSDPTGPAKKPDYRRKEIFGPKDSVTVVLDGTKVGSLKVKVLLP